MAMSPITQTVQGVSYTFMLPFAAMTAILTETALDTAWQQELTNFMDRVHGPGSYWVAATPAMWGYRLASTTTAACSRIPVDQILAILAQALIGGMAMAPGAAADTAERLYRNQFDRAVDRLVGTITQAAVAAG
jgi:hypothetical protein